MKLAVVTTDTGSMRIHAADCRTVNTEVRKFKANGAMEFDADNLQDAALVVWGDVAAKTAKEGTAEYRNLALELAKADDQIHGKCLATFPETDAAPAYGTLKTNARNKHLIVSDGGQTVKTLCDKAVSAVVREGEVSKRNLCTICAKAQADGKLFLTENQLDWSGEKPRITHVTVPGLNRDVPVREESKAPAKKATAKPGPRQASAAASVAKAEEAPKAAPKATTKKAPAKAPKGSIGTVSDVMNFLTEEFNRKMQNKGMYGSNQCALRRVFASFPQGMDTPVDDVTVDEMIKKFGDDPKNAKMKPVSIKGYSREAGRVFDRFREYKADVAAWEAAHPLPAGK